MQRDEIGVAGLAIRNPPSTVKERLRVRTARQGRSMWAEARAILQSALDAPRRPQETLTGIMRDLFGPEHGLDLDLSPRDRRPLVGYDAMIDAIAQTHGAEIVTRNVDDFDGCGVPIVTPWAG